tara:strand:+ start:204 stop:533 length:330 start_codon:yes stop_codon:yes gene_type:complete
MSATTTIVHNFILEPGNCSRYELVYFEYEDMYYGKPMCSVTWLNKTRGGHTFIWRRGESIFASYALTKTDISEADLGPILAYIKSEFTDSIGDLVGWNEQLLGKAALSV